jgi:hypothetical protein
MEPGFLTRVLRINVLPAKLISQHLIYYFKGKKLRLDNLDTGLCPFSADAKYS